VDPEVESVRPHRHIAALVMDGSAFAAIDLSSPVA
jgi:hypothetical protein